MCKKNISNAFLLAKLNRFVENPIGNAQHLTKLSVEARRISSSPDSLEMRSATALRFTSHFAELLAFAGASRSPILNAMCILYS